MRALKLTERAIKNEPKETYSIVQKGHRIKQLSTVNTPQNNTSL